MRKIYFLLLTYSMVFAQPVATTSIVQTESTTHAINQQNNLNAVKSKPVVRHENDPDNYLSPTKVVLNFENADIQAVIKTISQLSGKNFVIDPRVKGTVNIVSDHPIDKSDSYKVLAAALRMQGFATIEANGVIKVIPELDARNYGMRTVSDGGHSKKSIGDQMITKVFVIQHGSANNISNALRPMISSNSMLSVYPNSNSIIITDYASNIMRIGKVIERITTEHIYEPYVMTLQYAIASDLVPIIQNYLQSGGQQQGSAASGATDGPAITIIAEPITNSIIVYSPVATRLREIQSLIKKFDVQTGSNNSNLHVVYLKNGDAAHIADVLRSITNGQENTDLTPSSSYAKFNSEPSGGFQAPGGSSSTGSGVSANVVHTTAASKNNNQKDGPKILVQAEPTTNSLIIQAPQAIYRNLRMIIDMLDVRRAQIMIEALLVNVSQDKVGSFGIQWVVGAGNNNLGVGAVSNYAGAGNGLINLYGGMSGAVSGKSPTVGLPQEFYVGVLSGSVSIGGQTIPSISALADTISSNNLGNILSRPTIITLDNEEARILVGQNIPIPNGTFVNTANQTAGMTTTIARVDLGVLLQIKPLITQSGAIQLDIYQEDSSLDTSTISNANGASFFERKMRSSVLVDDGKIIVIGGMIQDSLQIIRNGIPLISNIPIIGRLFSWEYREHKKQTQILFIKPTIIRTASGYKKLTNDTYDIAVQHENIVQARGGLILPKIPPITLKNQGITSSPPTTSNVLITDLPIVDGGRGKVVDLTEQSLKQQHSNKINN